MKQKSKNYRLLKALNFQYWLVVTVLFLSVFSAWFLKTTNSRESFPHSTWWAFQSVDTMKESRDKAREKLNSESYISEIDMQVAKIAEAGATHVALATPYDKEFLPFLKRWVAAARKHNLKIWFRGNWSSWEGWFGYEKKMTFEEHINRTVGFIKDNPQLFEDGDFFTGCPECENGVQGDPRQTGKVTEYRQFLIDETLKTKEAFNSLGLNIQTNLLSMNKDVADLIMDRETTQKTGGIVTIDHYVKDPEKLNNDISIVAEKSGGKVVLGEWGAPIGDIHGTMSEEEQAEWVQKSLNLLSENKNLSGLSYWTNLNGSTAIWGQNLREKQAVSILKSFYKPKQLFGSITDQLGFKISDVEIKIPHRTYKSGKGEYLIAVFENDNVEYKKKGYRTETVNLASESGTEIQKNVVLIRENPPFWYKLLLMIRGQI